MAINNFTALVLQGEVLTLHGQTRGVDVHGLDTGKEVSPANTTIKVTVVSCDPNDPRRCDPEVDDPSGSTWDAVAPAGAHTFADTDLVYAVGETHVPGKPAFVWCNLFQIGTVEPLA